MRTPSCVSREVSRRTSHVAASSGPGLGHDETWEAARAMMSSSSDDDEDGGGGGALLVDTESAEGGDGGEEYDFLLAVVVVVSPPPPPPSGGRGGGTSGGASHRALKDGNIDVNIAVRGVRLKVYVVMSGVAVGGNSKLVTLVIIISSCQTMMRRCSSSNCTRSHRRVHAVFVLSFLIDFFVVLFTLHGAVTAAAPSTTSSSIITAQRRKLAIKELRTLVPPPPNRRALCGDYILNDDAYARYLSVSNWDPALAAPRLHKSIVWMTTMKPWTLRPHHCPVLCKQYAWVPLMIEGNKKNNRLQDSGDTSPTCQVDDNDDDTKVAVNDDATRADGIIRQQTTNNDYRSNIGHEYITGLCALGNSQRRTNNNDPYHRKKIQDTYYQPYDCPSSHTWRTTTHGLPITLFTCSKWRPDLATTPDEMDKHAAYTMTHLLKRIPRNNNNNNKRGEKVVVVSRVCIIFDLSGFETWMLPYIHRNIDLLREHYPGRAGAFCFINAPSLFRGVWKLIGPWLDDELRSKVHFANGDVNTVEHGIEYLNRMKLRVGPV